VGTITEYQPQEEDIFVCSIGGPARKKCMESIIERGGVFQTIIHKTARIGTNVRIGIGNVIAAYTSIGSEASVGNYNLIQSYTVIGHDVKIGDWNRIDTHVTCVGGREIRNCADVYTSAVLNHGVVVEDNAHVGALSFVIRRVMEGTTVMGNPAKKLM
jgi:UDP-3-O-[3-hydroxymyristoyl] glucosamine N-acyltransferase